MDLTIDTYKGEYIRKADHHLYIAPREELKDIVAHYTITFPNEDIVIPDNSVLNLIPDVSGCFVFHFFDKLSITIWGPTTKVVVVNNDLNIARCRFFVEFLPGGLYQVLGVSMKDILDQKIEMEELLPSIYDEINEKVNGMNSFDEMVDMMNQIIYREVQKNTIEDSIINCIKHVYRDKEVIQVPKIVEELEISQRQLSRYFNKYIGMGIKKYSQIVRMNHLIQEIIDKDLIDLTYDYEYFDQAHLNHVFKNICETTPNNYIENMSDFYNELYKF